MTRPFDDVQRDHTRLGIVWNYARTPGFQVERFRSNQYEENGLIIPPNGRSIFTAVGNARRRFMDDNSGSHDLDLSIQPGSVVSVVGLPTDSWMAEKCDHWIGTKTVVMEITGDTFKLDLEHRPFGHAMLKRVHILPIWKAHINLWSSLVNAELGLREEDWRKGNKAIHDAFRLGSARSLFDFCQRPEHPAPYRFQKAFALCTDQEIKDKFRSLLMNARRQRVPVVDKDQLIRDTTEMWAAQTTLSAKKDVIRKAEAHYDETFNSAIHDGGDDGVSGNWTWYPITKIEEEMNETDSTVLEQLVVDINNVRGDRLSDEAKARHQEEAAHNTPAPDPDVEMVPSDPEVENLLSEEEPAAPPTQRDPRRPQRIRGEHSSAYYHRHFVPFSSLSRTDAHRMCEDLLKDLCDEEHDHDHYRERARRFKSEKRSLKENIEQLTRDDKVKEMRLNMLRFNNDEATRARARAEKQVADQKREYEITIAGLKDELSRMTAERDTYMARSGTNNASSTDDVTERMASLSLENDQLRQDLHQMQDQSTQLATEIEQHQATIEEQGEDLETKLDQIRRLMDRMESSDQDGTEYEEAISLMQDRLEELEAENASMRANDLTANVMTPALSRAGELEKVTPAFLRSVSKKKWAELQTISHVAKLERKSLFDMSTEDWRPRIRAHRMESSVKGRRRRAVKAGQKSQQGAVPATHEIARALTAEVLRNSGVGYVGWEEQLDTMVRCRRDLGAREGGSDYVEIVVYSGVYDRSTINPLLR